MTNRTIGIDLAIRGDHVAQIYDDGRPVGRPLRFRHDPGSLDAFVAGARAGIGPGDSILAVMEPTGMSRFPVAHRLADNGIAVTRVKGKRVKALRRDLSEHAKTDLADAHVLAAIPGFGGPELDPLHIPAPKSHALQRLTKQRSRFQDAIAAAKRRLLDLIRWASPALERVLPDLGTRLSMALLQRWVDPAAVLKARKSTLSAFIARHASGNHPHSGPFVGALVEGLRQAARAARDLQQGHVDFAQLQAEIAIEIDVMNARVTARADLDRRIETLYAELQPEDVLRTIPGVGRHLGPVLFGLLHSADRFRSDATSAVFAACFHAGRSAAGRNDSIKRALTLAADTARKIDPDLAEVYWRLMTGKGHHHKQALCAVANRLVNRIFSVLRSDRPYILRDHDGNEISVAQAKALIAERYNVPEAIRATRRATRSPTAV